ncbi:MAG: hypothetical protein ABMA14_14275 [Hyphomonadaceae bacterium]
MTTPSDSSGPDRTRIRALWVFAAASLLTIALGAVAMALGDVPLGIWIRNPIAWLVAGAISVGLASRGWLGAALLPMAVIVIALSFVGLGQEDVHRWLDLGPVQLNSAALVLPAAIAVFQRTRATIAVPIFAIIVFLLAWQPDISQLAGFSFAGVVLARSRFGWRGAMAAAALAAAAVALCLSRPNPLLPIPHVEGIFLLAWGQKPALSLAMGLALAVTSLTPLLLPPSSELRGPGMALAGYFALTGAAFLLGAYPVPLAGYGLSFVIGWWLGFACLSVRERSPVNSLTSP